MLVKLTGVDFTKILHTAFTFKYAKTGKKTDSLAVFLLFWDLQAQ